jgi:inner membrane protein
MLVFAHTGLAIGAASVVAAVANHREKKSWLESLSKYTDIRFLVIGSLLPDIIDKPIGHMFLGNGRVFAHTLLFLLLLIVVGTIVYRRNKHLWGLSLAAGVFMHLFLDTMWLAPHTLFWPFLGWVFEREDYSDYWHRLFQLLLSHRTEAICEIIGFIIVVWFGLRIIVKKQVMNFLKTGSVH